MDNIDHSENSAPIARPVVQLLASDQDRLERIATELSKFRYRYSSEDQLQERFREVLEKAGFVVEREKVLDAQSRADLWIDGFVVEVKVDGTLSAALRQIARYLKHPDVKGVILAGTSRWAGEPLDSRPEWGGKAFQMIRVQRQYL